MVTHMGLGCFYEVSQAIAFSQIRRAVCLQPLSFLFTARRVNAVFAVARVRLSVRPSVRLSRWWIVSRRLKISSNFFIDPVAPSF